MNTLRSTERHLTLLALNRKTQCTIKTRTFQTKSKLLLGQRNQNFITSRYVIRNPRIKLYTGLQKVESRILSQATRGNFSFLNPNKPNPDKADHLKPIIPLTLPRFPKKSSEHVPSVTKILQATMPAASQFLLDRWRESMIKKLGTAGFNKYQHETFERGRLLHALLANYLLGHGEPSEGGEELSKEVVSNLWKSIQNVVRESISNVRLVEHIVTHPDMNYRGIVDCVAFYKDELVVIDFKTAEKPKKNVESLFDNPLQVTAYCGAINCDSSIPAHVIDRNITSGLVIVAYVDGSEASTYYFGPEQVTQNYWKQWTTRLEQFSYLAEQSKN